MQPDQREALVDSLSSAIGGTLQLACEDILRAIPGDLEMRVMDALTNATPSIVDTAFGKALYIGICGSSSPFMESILSDKDSPIAAYALRCGQKFRSKATQ